MSDSRIVIVDYNHLIHIYMNSKAPRLFYTEGLGASTVRIETTIPAFTIKSLNRWARQGKDILAVCFDSPCPFRKDYFKKTKEGIETGIEYKGDRKPMMKEMYEGAQLTMDILYRAGVPIYAANGYEADDLVYSLVQLAKEMYPNTPIDVITNDADLLPLVDEQVSVFLRSRKITWAETKELEKRSYIQVTPDNFQKVTEELSNYQKFSVPYNTLLLHKLLRGDDSDGIPPLIDSNTGRKDFPPKMYNELIYLLAQSGVDLAQIFRYTRLKPISLKKDFLALKESGSSISFEEYCKAITDSQLDTMCSILSDYVDEATIEHVKFIYGGMNLRFIGLVPPTNYNEGKLRVECSKLNITIPTK